MQLCILTVFDLVYRPSSSDSRCRRSCPPPTRFAIGELSRVLPHFSNGSASIALCQANADAETSYHAEIDALKQQLDSLRLELHAMGEERDQLDQLHAICELKYS